MDLRKELFKPSNSLSLKGLNFVTKGLNFLEDYKIEDILYTIKLIKEKQKADKIERVQKDLEQAQKRLNELNKKN